MKLRIVFFGTPQFAVPSLVRLAQAGHDVVAVYAQPDKAVGRKKVIAPGPVKRGALSLGLPVIQPSSLKDDATYEQFAVSAPDLCVVVAYGKLIPKRFLDVPRMGFINVHPSLVPRWRGPSPIQSAILNGDRETGVTIMQLDEDMDHGPVLAQHRVALDGTEYYPELSGNLADIGAHLLTETVGLYAMDAVPSHEQKHEEATFCTKLTRQDARIDWTLPAVRIERLVRATAGEPTAWTTWHGKVVNILRARSHPHQEPQTPPGTVLSFEGEVLVDTPDGTLVLERVQPAGRTAMTAQAFTLGNRGFIGSRLE